MGAGAVSPEALAEALTLLAKAQSLLEAALKPEPAPKQESKTEKKSVTVKQFAEMRSISTETVLRWIRHEEFPAHRFGRTYRIELDRAQAWLDSYKRVA